MIVGIQLHHSVHLSDATRGFVNGCAGLAGAAKRTGDERLQSLLVRAETLIRDVSQAESAARRRMQELYIEDPQAFIAARDGKIPWPDEMAEGFVPRCSCYDRCLVHDSGVIDGTCNCDAVCPKHVSASQEQQ